MWDSIDALRKQFHRSNPVLSSERPKKILFNSQFAWPYAIVEYTLAAALRERGHDVRMLACGGLPKYCELMTSTQQRPPCGTCHRNVAKNFDAFGLPHATTADYLTDSDRAEAARIAADTPMEELRALVADGVPVGELAFFNLFQYFKGYPFDLSGEVGQVFRDAVSSAILVGKGAGRAIDDFQPDVVCTANGKFLQWSPFIYHAVKRNIQYVTWEDYQIRPSAVAFATNDIAHETRQTAVWRAELEKPLTVAETRAVREHYRLWSAGEVTPWAGYSSSLPSADSLRAQLKLRPDVPVVALFPNLAWDASSLGFETAFSSMYEWLYELIAYAARRPDIDFVIRAHPAEARLPQQYRPPVPVCDAVRQNCPVIPSNLRLVEGGEPVNSYELAALADVNMVYTSTLGMELPLRGIRPWAAAGPYYAGKGFTLDLESRDHMCSLLDSNVFGNSLSPAEVERAERMAYLIRFRGIFDFPLMPEAGGFSAGSWQELTPDGNRVLNTLCEKLLNHEAFIDLDTQSADAVAGRHAVGAA